MPPEMMKNMPQEIRDAMENMRIRTMKVRGHNGAAGQSVIHGKMKIVVEKDGKRSEYETELGDSKAGGTAITIPPGAIGCWHAQLTGRAIAA